MRRASPSRISRWSSTISTSMGCAAGPPVDPSFVGACRTGSRHDPATVRQSASRLTTCSGSRARPTPGNVQHEPRPAARAGIDVQAPVHSRRSRLHAEQTVAVPATARRGQPRPSSATCTTSPSRSIRTSISAWWHLAWRAILLTASLKMRRTSRRTSAASARSRPASGALKGELDVLPGERVAREVAHPLKQVTDAVALGIDRPDDVAHRIDELTRDRRDAIECVRGRPGDRRPRRARHLAQDGNLREAGTDVVVQIGRNSRADTLDREQLRDAVPIEQRPPARRPTPTRRPRTTNAARQAAE